jgi:hypothetical protein
MAWARIRLRLCQLDDPQYLLALPQQHPSDGVEQPRHDSQPPIILAAVGSGRPATSTSKYGASPASE